MLGLLIMAAIAAPSPEAVELGKQLAATGSLATILPAMATKQTEEVVQAHPELTVAEQEQLRTVAKRVFDTDLQRVITATGEGYATRLSLDDLKSLVAFAKSPASIHYREAMPAVTANAMQMLGSVDFKGDTLKAFCAETKRLCAQ